jgi:DNA gyrase subunit A
MITARGKLQRIAANEISIVGRNTQGVRVMNLDQDDTLVAVKRVPHEDSDTEDAETPVDEASKPAEGGETEPKASE